MVLPISDACLAAFSKQNILIIGDIILDHYLQGNVDRISPEAPVPIVNIKQESYRLGGAANVALNIKALGAQPLLMSVLGQDIFGQKNTIFARK
jgi:bifunctional ADP-heptose synthase (sugar kinase/adenylyltransferase)